nr:ABC transporter G family member 11-like [Ipomoea batatas]
MILRKGKKKFLKGSVVAKPAAIPPPLNIRQNVGRPQKQQLNPAPPGSIVRRPETAPQAPPQIPTPFYYSAQLQLPSSVPRIGEKDDSGHATIKEMGLRTHEHENRRRWGEQRISGGQKRQRVSICLEILHRPQTSVPGRANQRDIEQGCAKGIPQKKRSTFLEGESAEENQSCRSFFTQKHCAHKKIFLKHVRDLATSWLRPGEFYDNVAW